MKFTKYEQRGAYHWDEYERGTNYGKHADLVKDWVEGKRILDVGAGDGLITYLLGAEGIDNEESGVLLAKQKGVDVSLGDVYEMPYGDEEFDAVFMGDTIEHLQYPHEALTEIRRVLDGALYITTPPKKEEVSDPFHYQEWTPDELVEMVETCGFRSVEKPFVKYNRIYAKFVTA